MSVGLQITVTGEGAELPRRVLGALSPARINPVIGRAATNAVVAHLRAKNASSPNALGGRRTNYYAAAARGTSFAVVSDSEVVVSIAQIGIRQRFFGGTIRPKTAKYLTIPAIAAAHGKRAREFGDLKFAIIPGKGAALVRQSGTGKQKVQTVVFWLRRQVTQRADATVLPERALVYAGISAAVQSTVERAARTSNP